MEEAIAWVQKIIQRGIVRFLGEEKGREPRIPVHDAAELPEMGYSPVIHYCVYGDCELFFRVFCSFIKSVAELRILACDTAC